MAQPLQNVQNLQNLVSKGWLWQGQQTPLHKQASDFIDSGWPELNQTLGGGWLRGSVNELQIEQPFSGELALLLPVLRQQQQPVVWLNPPAALYAPGLQHQQLTNTQLVIRETDTLRGVWALEQCLQAGQVGMIIAWLPDLSAPLVRRLQQCAERHQQLVFIMAKAQPQVEARAYVNRLQVWRDDNFQIRILKRRYGWPLPPFPCAVDHYLPARRRNQPKNLA
ncbi:SulA-like leucine-rich domain-containing protein [Pseudidiomarina sp.]|uniref:SulA-like leucine-rich domain-containing protein n=1 Tax=Pseudidiomarina sp. TaxID=2081707 RepID=UPI00299F2537|nr:SulA-like leucine-rich domain-containing protein [Pseudidiomarina sp.]MDX1706818.1 SulA-like leucine-rich domain-containing protein [Pseudidiomarina sp.]